MNFDFIFPFIHLKTPKVSAPVKQQEIKAYHGNAGSSRFGNDYRSGGAKWVGGLSGTGNDMLYDHGRIRTNARNAFQDSIHAHGMVNRWADSVADVGLRIDCIPIINVLGISLQQGKEWGKNTSQRFNMWGNSKSANRSEIMTFKQSHRLYVKDDVRDGENFIRLFYSNEKSLLNPLQFDFLDPNQIRGDAFTSTLGPLGFGDGIERDKKGREKSYRVWTTSIVNNNFVFKDEVIPRIGEKSKRIMMLHAFAPEFPGQTRGFSKLTHTLQEFQNLTDFTLAQIKKAINQSNIVMSSENQQQDPSNPTVDRPIGVPGGGVKIEGGDPADGSATDANEMNVQFLNEISDLVPGSTAYLNLTRGDRIKFHENTAPSENFDSFVHAFMKYICASTGMPIEVLEMKFSSSYSSARAALLMFWRVAKIWRDEMASDYLNPVFEMWLSGEIGAGRISAPGWSDPVLRRAWLNCIWIGAPMPNIDPLRTSKADKEYLGMNATDLDRVAGELNGSDAEMNMMKNKEVFENMPRPPWDLVKEKKVLLNNDK